jgi:hypothetical protein
MGNEAGIWRGVPVTEPRHSYLTDVYLTNYYLNLPQ